MTNAEPVRVAAPDGRHERVEAVRGARAWTSAFIDNSSLTFGQRAEGYESDAAIIQALQTQPNVAVVDVFALAGNGGFGGDWRAFALNGVTADDKTFAPTHGRSDRPGDGAAGAR